MNKRSTLSLAVAAVLAVGACAPSNVAARVTDGPASGGKVVDGVAPEIGPPGVEEKKAPDVAEKTTSHAEAAPPAVNAPAASAAATEQDKDGNAFLRAITAPFRALARLLGGDGGKKNGGTARGRQDGRREASKADEQATLARITSNAEQSPAAEPRARVMPQPPPLLWKPYIENVPMDHLSQGRALLEFGYFGEAIAELSLAATLGPDLVEANNLLGQAHDKVGAHEQAREYYERALSLAPQNPWLRHNLGYSFFLDDQYENALRHLRQAERGAPTDVRIANSVGLVQFRLHKFDDALKTFARLEGEYAARLKLADMLERAGWDDEAVRHYEAALRLRPNSTVALERLADLHQRAGRREQAEALRRTLKNLSHAGGG